MDDATRRNYWPRRAPRGRSIDLWIDDAMGRRNKKAKLRRAGELIRFSERSSSYSTVLQLSYQQPRPGRQRSKVIDMKPRPKKLLRSTQWTIYWRRYRSVYKDILIKCGLLKRRRDWKYADTCMCSMSI